MTNNIFIPTKIKVGFNARTDTYTGKLGYVIYHDGKKWRKEPSWENWRVKYYSEEQAEDLKQKQYAECIANLEGYWNAHVIEYSDEANLEKHVKQYSRATEEQKKNAEKYWNEQKVLTKEEFIKQNWRSASQRDFDQYDYNNFKPFGDEKHASYYQKPLCKDASFQPQEYENIPMEGFVLNKKVGDYKSDWNHRSAYCRVYDPRGFEFEISFENLLFILESCTSTKGKGLEGKFIYGWQDKDLILIPEDSADYEKYVEFTQIQSGKVKAKELVVGEIYTNKDNKKVVYLGKYFKQDSKYFKQDSYYYTLLGTSKNYSGTKKFVFYNIEAKTAYWAFESFTSVNHLKVATGEVYDNYQDLFQNSDFTSRYSLNEVKPQFEPLTLEDITSNRQTLNVYQFDGSSWKYSELYAVNESKTYPKYETIFKGYSIDRQKHWSYPYIASTNDEILAQNFYKLIIS